MIPSLTSPSTMSSVRVLSHKRRRNGDFALPKPEDEYKTSQSLTESSCTTSGESSSEESDSCYESEDNFEEEVTQLAAKRRRRADLDELQKSVRLMEAHVVDASAQLKDLAALVAVVVAQRQQHT
ncbi:uncharacterized protein PHALS_09659 [Plasmopara halstedii]|uniref:Uncharacterized protein n=1 Tax=Plasmopara halstedii TaxID=4781 RepID=A0A0P1AET6_PLAHL|nr:uncharacterized protein PHALS_09659 [Plasmopara halstedii]CEG39410.1 hypothetical protein PHALS_09659 [Plasmopara halstedii]|eukprot:XP_024575779.1 hypothetical protein PHALS_09659 [Plasmopara halstedii]